MRFQGLGGGDVSLGSGDPKRNIFGNVRPMLELAEGYDIRDSAAQDLFISQGLRLGIASELGFRV